MILFCTPAESEIYHLRRAIESPVEEEWGGQQITVGSLNGREAAASTLGVGKVMAAAVLTALIGRLSPQAVFLGGVAGGLDPQLGIGDAVIGTDCLQWDLNAEAAGIPAGTVPRSRRGERKPEGAVRADPELLSAVRAAAARRAGENPAAARAAGACLHEGRLLSGDTLLTGRQEKRRLGQRFHAAAVDMESAAAALAAALAEVPFIAVRYILDDAEGRRAPDLRALSDAVSTELLHLWQGAAERLE